MDFSKEEQDKIKLVVFNENTLGYMFSGRPDTVFHLRASVLRGALWSVSKESDLIGKNDKVRLANEQDFDDYRCSFDGYEKDPKYIYAK